MSSSSKKGQIWTMDFISAIIMLSFILLLFIVLWNNLAMRWNSGDEYREMQTDALFASKALITTSGEPESWEMLPHIEGCSAIGLANRPNELNQIKMEKLVSSNATSYDFVKERLGVQRYELGIRITDLSRELTYYEFGKFAGQMNVSVRFERMGVLNGSAIIMQIEVWK